MQFEYLRPGDVAVTRAHGEADSAGLWPETPDPRGSSRPLVVARLGHFTFERYAYDAFWRVTGLMPFRRGKDFHRTVDPFEARPNGWSGASEEFDESRATWVESDGREGLIKWEAELAVLEGLKTSACYPEVFATLHKRFCPRSDSALAHVSYWSLHTSTTLAQFIAAARQCTVQTSELDARWRRRGGGT